MTSHLLSLSDLTADQITKLIARARFYKHNRGLSTHPKPLTGKTLAMIFEKPSTRTRVSFEVAMVELGGHALNLAAQESQLGRGESYADTARVLSRYVHGMLIRTYAQETLEQIASQSTIPVLNGLSDLFHPVQVLADLLTIQEEKNTHQKFKITYLGDGNNLANTWIEAAMILGFNLSLACPKGHAPHPLLQQKAAGLPQIIFESDPVKAVEESDVIYTDTWISMGQKEAPDLKKIFLPFQVNATLLKAAKPDAIVLHCLPAHRGDEITDQVIDGAQSRVFDQAENRLHIQKAILEDYLGALV